MRDATAHDIETLLALERACYPPEQAYDRAMYRHLLADGESLVIDRPRLGGEPPRPPVLAFIGAFTHRAWRVGHVVTLNVHPDARRRGLGARLLAAMEARLAAAGMRRVVLEVNVANAGAITLYETRGFVRTRRIVGYYERGYAERDAFVYEKRLDEKAGALEGAPPGQPRSHG